MSAITPKITSIDPTELAPRYVWLDEDDEQVSPIHKSFATALHFTSGWHARWERLEEKYGPYSEENSYHFQSAYTTMSRSGKPPVEMRRVMISISVTDLAEDEQSVVLAMMNAVTS